MAYVAATARLDDGRVFAQAIAARAGMVWLVDYMRDLAGQSGSHEVAVQSRGCPAMELVEPLHKAGLVVHEVDGSHVGSATGRIRDRVRDGQLVTVPQPDVELAVQGGVTRRYAENDTWSRVGSAPVDIAPLCAMTWALYALETTDDDTRPVSAYESADHGLMIL